MAMNEKKMEKALSYAKKSLEFENMIVTTDQQKLVEESLRGHITHKEFLERAVKLANG